VTVLLVPPCCDSVLAASGCLCLSKASRSFLRCAVQGKQPTHALQQQATAAAAGVASGAHTNASQQGKLVAEGDDGSLVVDTAAKPTAGLSASASGKTTLPPAAALHGHHDAATDAAARSQTVNELPDPFGAPDHHHDPVYAARIDPHAPAAGLYALVRATAAPSGPLSRERAPAPPCPGRRAVSRKLCHAHLKGGSRRHVLAGSTVGFLASPLLLLLLLLLLFLLFVCLLLFLLLSSC
jgi:hypothetical protein